MSQRVMVFIDNSNIFKGFKKYKIKADYEKLKNLILNGRELQNIFLYEGIVYPMSQNKKKWYNDLKNNSGYIVKASFDKRISKKTFEKKVDVKISIDMVSYAYEDAYDVAVLVSGDGDFLPVIRKVKDLNKEIEVWAFHYSLANVVEEELGPNAIFYIDDFLKEIEI
ncbi:MAG: NYN domain-containing protein [Candidatus Lokiarchaeota archaeon]|nr:NYN domain-containing protein [Candidatus Lokiarchaeota archaeon]MBD3200284.1 NYN domain-containing protein [Candidatus Lokiarchaeota archaeon]